MFRFDMPSLSDYAAARGLAFTGTGLLPPVTSVLKRGLGVGEHRSSVVTREQGNGWSAVGGLTRHPERITENLCRGVLPGGVDGVLAHHRHLELRSSGGDSGETWYLATDTVVVAQLPERCRAVCKLDVFTGSVEGAEALFSVDLSTGREPIAIAANRESLTEFRGGWTFSLSPAEDRATLDALAGPNVLAALAAAPAETAVELDNGVLCVSARGILVDPAALDALCAVASAVAAAVSAVAERHGHLDAAEPLSAPPASARQQWLDAGAARLHWPAAPASVAEARRAYEPLVSGRAKGSGHRARLAVLFFGLLACVVWFGVCMGGANLLGEDPLYAACFAVVTTVWGIWKTITISFEVAGEVRDDEVGAQAGPWALEAFAAGYARARGLALEDPDALRHRLSVPLGGRPQRAMHGDLGGGVRGHLALWRDWTDQTHWLVAAVPAPEGTVEVAPPYLASIAAGTLVVGRQVSEEDRSAAALDALIAETLRVAARTPVAV